MAKQTLIEIENVVFGYASRQILKGISLRVQRGSIVGIMGGSGCGKTTLLRLIGGQERPSQGDIRVAGLSVPALDKAGLFKLRSKMGMLFQFGALFTDLTVAENVAFPMREHTRLSDEFIGDLVLMKLNAVGLRGAAQLKPSELSGGMARRVALARTIALDPELVMYDEPFAGLDPISLSVVGQLIRKLNDTLGLTSILVSHDIAQSLKIVDYVYFVSDGTVVAEGTPESIHRSTDPFVRQFVEGLPDGPVPFHVNAPSYRDQLLAAR